MDDIVLWHNNKSKLMETKNLLVEFIEGMLHLSCKPSCINSCGRGLPFLGYVVFPQRVRLNKQSKKRFIRKLKIATARLEEDEWDQHEYARHITPLFAFAQHADNHSLRKELIS
jgi:RNA-directed DNA polymerase